MGNTQLTDPMLCELNNIKTLLYKQNIIQNAVKRNSRYVHPKSTIKVLCQCHIFWSLALVSKELYLFITNNFSEEYDLYKMAHYLVLNNAYVRLYLNIRPIINNDNKDHDQDIAVYVEAENKLGQE